MDILDRELAGCRHRRALVAAEEPSKATAAAASRSVAGWLFGLLTTQLHVEAGGVASVDGDVALHEADLWSRQHHIPLGLVATADVDVRGEIPGEEAGADLLHHLAGRADPAADDVIARCEAVESVAAVGLDPAGLERVAAAASTSATEEVGHAIVGQHDRAYAHLTQLFGPEAGDGADDAAERLQADLDVGPVVAELEWFAALLGEAFGLGRQPEHAARDVLDDEQAVLVGAGL